ncbi:MAG TPA: hypothetical protein VKT20_04000 [Candidatus Dormibacteraeota bacterium]|nr:hypothetical protein [Candidatus Dormibacteraeota bacterium]
MSLFTNLGAGSYSPVERARKIAGNFWRKVSRRSGCCGNYGEPGC